MQLDTLFAKSNGLFLFSIFENFPLGGGGGGGNFGDNIIG